MEESKAKSGSGLTPELSATQKIKILVIVVCAVLVVVIVAQNTGPVEARLLFATITLPLAVLLFGCLAVGFILGIIYRTRLFRRK